MKTTDNLFMMEKDYERWCDFLISEIDIVKITDNLFMQEKNYEKWCD